MNFHSSFLRHRVNKYISINTRLCEACWDCLDVCPKQALGKSGFGPHRHIRIGESENCNGCRKCVLACAHHAIEYVYKSKHQLEAQAI